MKQKLLKILRIKITAIVCALVLLFIAVQTPWLKHAITRSLTKKLAEITNSEVSIESYDGFIPLNFDLNKLTFSQNNKPWLTINRLGLNRTLIRFFFWKNRGIDVSLIQPKLFYFPSIGSEKKDPFQWPELPFQQLSVSINAYKISIDPALTVSPMPEFNAFINLHTRKKGSIFHLKSSFNSAQLKDLQLHFQIRGYQKNNQVYANVWGSDLNQELSKYFFNQKIPGFEGAFSVKGNPESFIAFFNPKILANGTFKGSFKGEFVPQSEDSELIEAFLNKKTLNLSTVFNFESSRGLNIEKLDIEGSHLFLEGSGFLNKHYEFQNTSCKGFFSDLNFLYPQGDLEIDGKLKTDLTIQGSYLNPKIVLNFESPSIQLDYLNAKITTGKLEIQRESQQFLGALSTKGLLNESPYSFSSNFLFLNFKQYALKDLILNYGENKILAPSFKTFKNVYQGRINLHLENLAIFSPFVRQALQGNLEGEIIFDVNLPQGTAAQNIDLNLQGNYFKVSKLELHEYFLSLKGDLELDDWRSFEGPLLAKNKTFRWGIYEFENMLFALNPKNRASPYKFESHGPIAISSAGQLQYQEETLELFLRSLNGSLRGTPYSLLNKTTFEISKKQLDFSPVYLKVGSGFFYLNLDQKLEELSATAEQFPVEVLSAVISDFDLKGYINFEGKFDHIYSKTRGNIKGSFYQFAIDSFHNMPPFQGKFNADLKKSRWAGSAEFYEKREQRGTLDFDLPISIYLYPLKFDMDSKAQANAHINYHGAINPFIQRALPENHLLEGQVQVNLELNGSMSQPHLKGEASLKNGYYENLFLGLSLKDVSMNLKGKGNQLELESFSAKDDIDGTVNAKGSLSLNLGHKMPYYVDIELQKGRVIQFDFLDASFDGDMILSGDLERALLKGNLDVTQANILIPNRIGSGFPQLPVTYLYPKETKACSANRNGIYSIPIDFDLHLDIVNQLRLKGRGLDTIWVGHFDILGNDRDPQFGGKLTNREGTFVFAGKILNLEEGLIQFDGDLLKNTYINLTGTTSVHNASITAFLKGPILGPKLSFKSDPPYTETEILSLILFNEPVQKLTPFQAVALTHSLATLSGAYLGPDIIDKVRRGIGVDQLTFGSSLDGGGDYTTIQVGKYITRNVLVTLNRPLSIGTSPFVITAHVKGGFQLQTFFDENEISKILIQWKLSY